MIHSMFEYPLIMLTQFECKQHLINIFAVYGFIELVKNIKNLNSKPKSEPKREHKICKYYISDSEPESEPEQEDLSDPDYVVTSTYKRKLRKRKKII
jgi:hypothetical protein